MALIKKETTVVLDSWGSATVWARAAERVVVMMTTRTQILKWGTVRQKRLAAECMSKQ